MAGSAPVHSVPPEEVTAALLVIGDEILSGRTKDKNIGFIAGHCTEIGIRLREVRVVADDEAAIVTAANALRTAYTYVFTTGGIGPTHDDITADSIAGPLQTISDATRTLRRRSISGEGVLMTEMHSFLEKARGGSTSRLAALAWKAGSASQTKSHFFRLSWSDEALTVFRAIAEAAKRNDKAAMRLPIATLRSVLATHLPNALFVISDLGGIGFPKGEDKAAFFADVVRTEQDPTVHAIRASSLWIDNVLSPWAQKQNVDPQIVDRLRDLIDERKIIHSSSRDINLDAPVQSDFRSRRDATFALLMTRLAGRELFADLGPVKCEIRSQPQTNYLRFLTWPRQFLGEDLWSMTATFSVETIPGFNHPIVRLNIGRWRWCPDVPGAGSLRSQRRLGVSLMTLENPLSIQFPVSLLNGEITDVEDPAPPSTISQSDFRQAIRASSPWRLVWSYRLSPEPDGSPLFP